MWRKQDEPKPSSPAPDFGVRTSSEQPRALGALPAESGSAGGHVSKTISVKGEIVGREDLFIDGEVQGSIHITDGNVTVGPNGRVTADIEAREIVVRGKVDGTLRGHERVQIGRTGQAIGEVVTRRIAIEEGAIFRGKIDVVRAEEARAPLATEVATGTEAVRPVPVRAKDSQQ